MAIKSEELILSVETATRACSLALLQGSEILAAWNGDENFSASTSLLIEIQNILREAKIKTNDINLLAAAVGPGSFTGLRVGLATVKGLGAALQIPAIGIPTLEAIAYENKQHELICSILTAGRNEVFAQLFLPNQKQLQPFDEIKTARLGDILFELKEIKNLIFVAAPETQIEIAKFAQSEKLNNWQTVDLPKNLAVCVGKIAHERRHLNEPQFNDLRVIYGRGADIGKKKSDN